VTVHQADLKTSFPPRLPRLGVETAAVLAGTAFSAMLLVLTAIHAGPLWRDETNTLSMAQMPSLKELWNNLPFESFPPLWPLILRGWIFLGNANSDAGIRLLGLYVGLFFLASLWLCSRWTGGRAPTLSVALLGSLPALIFIGGANRAYGLASCLLVLCFGTIWRMVEAPSRLRVLAAGLVCFLFAQCAYFDAIFLCAMLTGGAVVAFRRRQWKTLLALAGIGALSGASMLIYLPVIHRASPYAPMNQYPLFNLSFLWHKIGDAVTARSSARPAGSNGPEIWIWTTLLLGGSVLSLLTQRVRTRQAQNLEAASAITARRRADLGLFSVVSMLIGTVGYCAILLKLQYPTQKWYYVEMLSLCAISLDGMLGASWFKPHPWGMLRVGFMVVMMTWTAGSGWEEAHSRRSNVDLIADVLSKNALEGDLIVVHSAWEGVAFNRYYHGRALWVTVPPIAFHNVHRNDLLLEKLNQRDPMAPVLREITSTLRKGKSIWLVGEVTFIFPKPLPPPPSLPSKWGLGKCWKYWSAQVTTHLLEHALQEQVLQIPVGGPVCCLENLPIARFSGYRVDTN
jgi:hypothetical protein